MSFDTPVTDQVATPNVTADQPLSFTVGDRTFNAESASTKISAADEHIARLEAENASYKLKVEQSTSIEDALAKLNAREPAPVITPEQTSSISEDQVSSIATKQIEEYLAAQQFQQAQDAAATLKKVTYEETGAAIQKQYGEKTNEAMANKAAELGMTTDALFAMAETPATAAMLKTIMKIDTQQAQASPTGGFNFSGAPATDKFVDYSKPITSGTIVEALKAAGGGYN